MRTCGSDLRGVEPAIKASGFRGLADITQSLNMDPRCQVGLVRVSRGVSSKVHGCAGGAKVNIAEDTQYARMDLVLHGPLRPCRSAQYPEYQPK